MAELPLPARAKLELPGHNNAQDNSLGLIRIAVSD